jgi:hypothetical protein
VGVDGGDDVEETGDDDEAGAPVSNGELGGVRTETHDPTNHVEESAAEVAEEAKHFEDVVGVGVELALHGETDGEHADDGDSEQGAATPLAKQEMSRAGDQPTCDKWEEYKALLCGSGRDWFVGGARHSFLTISQPAGRSGSGICGMVVEADGTSHLP